MSEYDSGSGGKGFVHDVMRRISSSTPRGGDSPEGSRERGPSRSYQDEVEDLQDAIRLFGSDSLSFGLLLTGQLGYPNGRSGLGGEIVEQFAIVGRIFLFAEARAQVNKAD